MARRRGLSPAARDALYHRLVTAIDPPSRRSVAEIYARKGAITAHDHEQAQAQPRRSS